jgi:hypothetical protein
MSKRLFLTVALALLPVAAQAAGGDTSAPVATPTGATTPASLAAIASRVLTPEDFGAPADTQRVLVYGVTTTAGSPNVTLAATVSPADAGKYIVIAGAGTSGAPLVSTIVAYLGAGHLRLAGNAQTTLNAATEWVWWGHDDAAAINAALASNAQEVTLHAQNYGIVSQINLPANRRVHLRCGGATIASLAPVTQQVMQAGNGAHSFFAAEGSTVDGCRLDGAGISQYNITHQGFGWSFNDIVLRNATVTNLLCNGKCENNYFSKLGIYNDSAVETAFPAYNIDVEYSDNHFTDIIVQGSATAGFHNNSNGTYVTNFHAYGLGGPAIIVNGSQNNFNSVYADSIPSNTTGFQVNGSYSVLSDWHAYVASGSGQSGVTLASISANNLVTGGVAPSIASDNVVVQAGTPGSSGLTNTVQANGGASYASNNGCAGGFSAGFQVRCNGGFAVSIGPYASANYGGIAIGHSTSAYGNWSASLGTGASDYGIGGAMVYAGSTAFGSVGLSQSMHYVMTAIVSTTSATRLTTNGNSAGSDNSPMPNPNVSSAASLSCRMTVHSTTSNDLALFYMDGTSTSVPALLSRPYQGALALASNSGTWANGPTTSGASGKLTPSVAVDSANNNVNISVTASTGTWHAVADCWQTEAD